MNKLLARLSFTSIIIWVNLVILVTLVWFGSYYYASALGWGDSLDLFRNPQKISEFLSFWYTNVNGRFGQTLLTSLFLPFRWGASTPESFPWWLASSFALFCTLLSPVHLMLAAPTRISHDWRFMLLIPLIWVIWSFNPISFYNRQLFTLLELTGYSLPIYIVSVAVVLLNRVPSSFFAGPFAPAAMVVGGLVFSLLGEQYLLAMPVFVMGISLMRISWGDYNSKVAGHLIGWTVTGTITGFVIYWFSPGQQIRHELIRSLKPFSLWQYYEQPVINGYQMLLHLPEELHPNLKIFIVCIHSLLLLLTIKWAKDDLSNDMSRRRSPWQGLGLFVATLLAAYHACFLTLLVAAYLPGYAYVFPLQLLAVALVLASLNIFRRIWEIFVNRGARFTVVVAGVLAALTLILYVGGKNWRSNVETARLVEQNNQRRIKVYGQVLDDAKQHGIRNFALINCPFAYPMFSWTMEPPWGLSGYFTWQRYPSVNVYLQGNSDFPPDWEKGDYKIIKCVETERAAP